MALTASREKWLSQQGGRICSLSKEGEVAISARREKGSFSKEGEVTLSARREKWLSQQGGRSCSLSKEGEVALSA